MKPGEQALDLPTAAVAAQQHAAILRGFPACICAEPPIARRNVRASARPADHCHKRSRRSGTREIRPGSVVRSWVRRAWFHEVKRWPRARREEGSLTKHKGLGQLGTPPSAL